MLSSESVELNDMSRARRTNPTLQQQQQQHLLSGGLSTTGTGTGSSGSAALTPPAFRAHHNDSDTDSDPEAERKDAVDPPPQSTGAFFDLPPKDQRNFLMLVLLYFLQGVPMGLAMGSVPFLLKSRLSYGQIGVFSLAAYPYSMKLAWSPIVDAVWSRRMGRRKSWIVPIQTVSGLMLLWLGARAGELMEHAEERLYMFTFTFFMLVMLCATQDIAVDGWAITLLSQENLGFASTAQTVGLTAGQFLSFTVFLAFNSKEFANRWFREVPGDHGIFTLGGYLTFWGWAYLVVTVGLAVFNKEDKIGKKEGLGSVYKTMWKVMKLKRMSPMPPILHPILMAAQTSKPSSSSTSSPKSASKPTTPSPTSNSSTRASPKKTSP